MSKLVLESLAKNNKHNFSHYPKLFSNFCINLHLNIYPNTLMLDNQIPTSSSILQNSNTPPIISKEDLDMINIVAKETAEESKAVDIKGLIRSEKCQVVKLAVTGNVDSGKTTLVGVLAKGIADDGRGGARSKVFNFNHEAKNGRTASIGQEIMGFDENGNQVLAERFVQSKNKYWPEVVSKSKKVVTLLDLCGHEKYLKTTMYGLVGMVPDYVMIVVGANMGISRMTREHLGVTLALKIPFFVVLTKTDMCPDNIYNETMETLLKILKSGGVNRKPIVIRKEEDINAGAEALGTDRICPIFSCSSVTGDGLEKLTKFISLLTDRNKTNKFIKPVDAPIQFDIKRNFMVGGVGIVTSGIVRAGTIKIGSTIMLGPDRMNAFRPVVVKSIHVNRVITDQAVPGEIACLSIRPVNKKDSLSMDDFRKGMVMIDPSLKMDPVWEFDAEVLILHHSTTIRPGYQAVLHCGVIRQSIMIDHIPQELLRTGDKAIVKFRFMYNAEYLRPGLNILLREGRTKILGIVTKVHEQAEQKKEVVL